ncbi:MAG TPA: LuxR C-terminal-related transcriptional regulator, partial [Candidatus Eisenbacteria bacterium]|nr:LuxR C-terminal-related transcriptional regulator [Candidatus Eisenbacteria bacterium]
KKMDNCMSIEDLKTVERLGKLVSRLTSNVTLREDLLQEALVHLWQIQQQQPGQTESWYLQNCRYHLQHYLASGRSVDSHKRSGGRVHPPENGDDHDSLLDIFDNDETCDAVLADVSARDIITSMSKWLPDLERTVLQYLAEGLGTCDIAKKLNISHPMVIKHRRKIAALATKLAIASLPKYRKKAFTRLDHANGEKHTIKDHQVEKVHTVSGNQVNGASKTNGKNHNGNKSFANGVDYRCLTPAFRPIEVPRFAVCDGGLNL